MAFKAVQWKLDWLYIGVQWDTVLFSRMYSRVQWDTAEVNESTVTVQRVSDNVGGQFF